MEQYSKPPINKEFEDNFNTSLGVGRRGEMMFENFMSATFPAVKVENMADDEAHKWKDIDFLLHYPNGTTRSVELKTDTYPNSPNFAIETIANQERNRLGWLHTSEADVLAYLFINGLSSGEPNLWMMDMNTLRDMIRNDNSFREVKVKAERQVRGEGMKTTLVKLVPRSKVKPLATYRVAPIQTSNSHSARGARENDEH